MEEEILKILAREYALLELHSIRIAERMKMIKDEIQPDIKANEDRGKDFNKWSDLVERFKIELKKDLK